MSAHIEKRDAGDVEITTQGIIDLFKSGITKTFSDDNINVGFLLLIKFRKKK
jgi:hypothetical protein